MSAKRIISLIVVSLILVTLLVGCDSTETTDEPSVSPTSSESTSKPDEQPGEKPSEAPAELKWPVEPRLPLADSVIELTAFIPSTGAVGANMTSLNDSLAYQEIEKLTNVRLVCQHPSLVAEQEQFNLMITSDDLTDIMVIYSVGSLFAGGVSKYADDGYIVDLTDYLDTYAPNYQALRNSKPSIYKETMDDQGRVLQFKNIAEDISKAFLGFLMREDWLEKAGVASKPITYVEWHDALTKMKDYANIAPLLIGSNGIDRYFTAGFGIDNGFINKDGKVIYSPITDEFKQYVTLMRQWYAEGLIDPDFFTRQMFYMEWGKLANGDWAAMQNVFTFVDIIEGTGKQVDPDFSLTGVLAPKLNANDKRRIPAAMDGSSYVSGQSGFISTVCEYPEIAIQYFDFFFSEQGAMLSGYGIEGQSYTIGSDGRPKFTALINANPEGLTSEDAKMYYAIGHFWPKYVFTASSEVEGMREKTLEIQDYWASDYDADNNYAISEHITPTEEESRIFSATFADIQTLVDENVVKFITGQKDMSEWDAFIDQIKSMGIDECIRVRQAAVDRFLTRGE